MTENLSRAEARARSTALSVSHHRIDLDVSEAGQRETFATRSVITIDVREPITTFLDFIGIVHTVIVDGEPIDVNADGSRVYLPELAGGEHTVEVAGEGRYSSTGEGLHRFRDPQDNHIYLYSQFEPADARRVFPNLEQPDLKTCFDVSITAPHAWTVLSNGAEIARENAGTNSAGETLAKVSFATTKPIPTYLTAFIAGPYASFHDVAELDDQRVDLGFYCRASLAAFFDLADIATVTKQGLATLPAAYGYPYPWGKYDSVFVPEYNLGAMENPGCVTFSEDAYIHRGLSTRAQRAGRANTILHEMAHMWFGDLTTPVWWDDLWLKESFAEFMGAWASVQATQYTEAWVNFAGSRLDWALATDQLPTTHPIVADIPDLEAADQAFDGITYAKGAAVLRQLVAYVGEDAFFAGVRAYFRSHAFSNATLDDLLTALQEASGRDLGEWSDQWLHTTGVSTVVVNRGTTGVTLTQTGTDASGAAIARPHRLKVSGFAVRGGVLTRLATTMVDLRTSVEIPWELIGGADVDLVLPNDDSLSYIKTAFDDVSLEAALTYDISEALSRSVVSGQLWQMTRDGRLSAHRYAEYVVREAQLADSNLLASRTRSTALALATFTSVGNRSHALRSFADHALAARDDAAPGSDQYTVWTRTVASVARHIPHMAELHAVLAQTTDQDLRWQLLVAGAANGTVDQATLDAELAATGGASDVVQHLRASASLSGTRSATVERLMNDQLSNDHLTALVDGFTQPLHAAEARRELPDFFARIEGMWESRSQELAERLVYGLYPMSDLENGHFPEDNADVRAATAWLETATDAPAALRKIIRDQRDHHLRALRNQEIDSRI